MLTLKTFSSYGELALALALLDEVNEPEIKRTIIRQINRRASTCSSHICLFISYESHTIIVKLGLGQTSNIA